jgi:hypothetical protein
MRYKDPVAFRRALSDRLRAMYPDQDVNRVLKRAMMERFLARTAATLPDTALLKGGYALELRLDRARATRDLDMTMRNVAEESVIEALRDAGETDLGDHVRYRIAETSRSMHRGAPYGGDRVTVIPMLGGQPFMPFPLDVGVGDAVAGVEVLRGGVDLSFAGLPPLEVPAIPVEVHVAEKLHALSLPRSERWPNSRVKDLVDVVLLQRCGLPDAAVLRAAVRATFERRGTHDLPERIDLPLASWDPQYRRLSIELGLTSFAPTVHDAAQRLHELLAELQS